MDLDLGTISASASVQNSASIKSAEDALESIKDEVESEIKSVMESKASGDEDKKKKKKEDRAGRTGGKAGDDEDVSGSSWSNVPIEGDTAVPQYNIGGTGDNLQLLAVSRIEAAVLGLWRSATNDKVQAALRGARAIGGANLEDIELEELEEGRQSSGVGSISNAPAALPPIATTTTTPAAAASASPPPYEMSAGAKAVYQAVKDFCAAICYAVGEIVGFWSGGGDGTAYTRVGGRVPLAGHRLPRARHEKSHYQAPARGAPPPHYTRCARHPWHLALGGVDAHWLGARQELQGLGGFTMLELLLLLFLSLI
ncbi:hypothetical protein CALVIDRAFT_542322 [Calocera viscosa TUFC12733]|uniref:Uncharacterized protein n=1 Tax=Calocera viscosa (strain TUFC12733) TaxID=1330018 RepID=A0A167GSM5_CALVF|nr:hypothetical protein CALVIDRAFT_542322 [Calocera viscosa TUFC12733]